jgi:hypothetical protein
VAHACNPNYSGGRDQEDGSLRPAQANSLETLYQKYPSQKGLVEWLKVKALSLNSGTWYREKKKKVNISRKIELAQCQPRSG